MVWLKRRRLVVTHWLRAAWGARERDGGEDLLFLSHWCLMLFALWALITQQSRSGGQTRAASLIELVRPSYIHMVLCTCVGWPHASGWGFSSTRGRNNRTVVFFVCFILFSWFPLMQLFIRCFISCFIAYIYIYIYVYVHTRLIHRDAVTQAGSLHWDRERSSSRTTYHTVTVLHDVPFSFWASEDNAKLLLHLKPLLLCTKVSGSTRSGVGDMAKKKISINYRLH